MSDAPKAQTQAGGYERRIGRYGPELAAAFISAAGIEPGDRVLDVGCGTGALTVRLVELLGADRVAGIDPGADDVAVCAERCPGVELQVGEAESLPYEDGRFDAALAQLVIGHLRDAERGVREMARVVVPGGRVAACVWDFAEGMVLLRSFWDAAAEVDAEGAAHFDQAARQPYTRRDQLQLLWEAADLQEVRTGPLMASAGYTDFDDLWEPMTFTDGAPGRFLATLDAQNQEQVRERLYDRLGRPDGQFRLEARAWFALGRAP